MVRPHSSFPQISTKRGHPSWLPPCHPRVAGWRRSSYTVSVCVPWTRKVVSFVLWADRVIRVLLSPDHFVWSSHSPLTTTECPMGAKGAQAFAQALESQDSALQSLLLKSACVMISFFLFAVSFPSFCGIVSLDLAFSGCEIGTQGAHHLARALASPNCKLRTLVLFCE